MTIEQVREDQAVIQGAAAPRVWMPSLSGIRWWAAIAVIIHHTLNAFVGTGFIKLDELSTFSSGGYLAVTLFFILSGFVLTWGWKEKWAASAAGRRDFYKNRFARIYPLYLLCIPIYYWYVNHVLQNANAHVTGKATVAEVLLVHSAIPYREYYGAQSLVTWSLSCEAIFYALLPLILVKLWHASMRTIKIVGWLAAAWLVVLPVGVCLLVNSEEIRRGFELNPLFCGAQFLLGVCAGLAFRRGWRPTWNPNLVLIGLLASFFVASCTLRLIVFGDWNHLFGAQPRPADPAERAHLVYLVGTRLQFARFTAHALITPAAFATVVALASADLRGKKNLVSGRFTVLFGDWSYSIYLSHAIVLGYAWNWWREHDITAPGIQLLIVFASCLIVAGLLHYLVEKPASKALRKYFADRDAGVRYRPITWVIVAFNTVAIGWAMFAMVNTSQGTCADGTLACGDALTLGSGGAFLAFTSFVVAVNVGLAAVWQKDRDRRLGSSAAVA